MEELSIFVDELGDLGKFNENCPYYIVSLVLHEQKNSITEQVEKLDLSLLELGLKKHTIHTGPLIRREQSYSKYKICDRFKIFNKLFHFTRNVNIKYTNLIIDKKQCKKPLEINAAISKQLSILIRDNLEYFTLFDKIMIYYDNGQIQLTNILVAVFSAFFNDDIVEFRDVFPSEYKLFQTADFICALSLINHKLVCNKPLTKSEEKFFGSPRQLRKNYVKHLQKFKF